MTIIRKYGFFGLKNIRKSSGKTQEQVARDLDVSLNTYRNWEQLKHLPTGDGSIMLADYFGVSVDDLLGRPSDIDGPRLQPMSNSIPLYGSISAGEPLEMQTFDQLVPIPDRFFIDGNEYFYLVCDGESMNKVILNGDYALIKRTTDYNQGDVVAVIINGYDAVLKHIYKTSNSLILSPNSHDKKFEDLVFADGDEEAPEVTILGVMKWKMGALD